MSKQIEISIVYPGGKTLTVTNTFETVVEMILTEGTFKNFTPLKLKVADAPGVLYFDRNLFAAFHEGGLHYSDLIEQTHCDEVLRNWLDVIGDFEVIDAGALWKQKGNELTLIDDDRHAVVTLPHASFKVAN